MRKADKKVSQLDITLSRFFKFIQENLPEWISQFKIINCYTIRDADNVLRLPSTEKRESDTWLIHMVKTNEIADWYDTGPRKDKN